MNFGRFGRAGSFEGFGRFGLLSMVNGISRSVGMFQEVPGGSRGL